MQKMTTTILTVNTEWSRKTYNVWHITYELFTTKSCCLHQMLNRDYLRLINTKFLYTINHSVLNSPLNLQIQPSLCLFQIIKFRILNSVKQPKVVSCHQDGSPSHRLKHTVAFLQKKTKSLSCKTVQQIHLIWIMWIIQFAALFSSWCIARNHGHLPSETGAEQLSGHDQSRTNQWCH